ncbi:MAG: RluA family pseudouridine synthase [Chloroflexaceae bacterium]|nr:RluA family pseudouridine synthase [Chloroflexaceae bacterium]
MADTPDLPFEHEHAASSEPFDLVVPPEAEGERLDRYVVHALPEYSRSFVRNLIDDRHILVNQQSVKAGYALRVGDVVRVQPPPVQPTELLPEAIPLDIVYEDAAIAVVNKPAGMVVHPAPGHARSTLVNALLARYPDIVIGGTLRPGIVHRLDQDTSGLLVVARNDQAMKHLTNQQKARAMHKAYLAVVEGRMQEPNGTIDLPLGRHPHDRKRQAVLTDGRAARTHYRVVEQLGAYTLLEARLETGRTHQIRVHFAHQQRPVLGDQLYGPRKRPTLGIARQFLHAHELGFVLPTTGEWHTFQAPLPPDLAAMLDKLRRMR